MLIRIDYPIIPWVGVMAIGYAMGPLFRESPERRQKILVGIGVSAVIGFIGLRWLNSYGDPMPWSVETRGTHTLLSFLRVRKYPPSLAYLLMIQPQLAHCFVSDNFALKIWAPLFRQDDPVRAFALPARDRKQLYEQLIG